MANFGRVLCAEPEASLRALLNDYFAQSDDVLGLLTGLVDSIPAEDISLPELKALLAGATPESYQSAIDDDDTADDSKDAAQFSLLLQACRRDGVKAKYIKQYLNPLLEDDE